MIFRGNFASAPAQWPVRLGRGVCCSFRASKRGNCSRQLHDAPGSAGSSTGWGLYDVSGILDLSALTPGSKFNINIVPNHGAAGFANDLLGGAFGLRVTGTSLELTFTPVPEPGTWLAAA